jgi:hypothetical protein
MEKINDYRIPVGFLVDIRGKDGKSYAFGDLLSVTVYRSLEGGLVKSGVNHIQECGRFRLDGINDLSVKDFLIKIREGIDEVIENYNLRLRHE